MLEVSSWRGTLGRPFIDIDRERSERILEMVDEGWRLASAHPSVHGGAGEVEITECLRDGMRAALGERATDYRYRQMIVQGGTESRSSPEVLRPDGRTDVSVLFNDIREDYNEHDPHAIVECKRVAGNRADLCREYVTEGIDRFAAGKYARNHAIGFMVGYLLSDDVASAAACINARLTRKRRQSEHLGPCVIAPRPWARSSRHSRASAADPIALHHAFLGLQPAPSPARVRGRPHRSSSRLPRPATDSVVRPS